MAGVPASVVDRAQIISTDFYKAFQDKLDARRRSSLPLQAHADFVYLMNIALGKGNLLEDGNGDGGAARPAPAPGTKASVRQQLDAIRHCIGKYEVRQD
jgi:DNA mismatch repair protein MSH6